MASMANPPMEPMAAAPAVLTDDSVAAGVLVALDAAVGVVTTVSVSGAAVVVASAVVSTVSEVVSAAAVVVSAASVVVSAAAEVVSAAADVVAAAVAEVPPLLTAAQRAWTAGRTLSGALY